MGMFCRFLCLCVDARISFLLDDDQCRKNKNGIFQKHHELCLRLRLECVLAGFDKSYHYSGYGRSGLSGKSHPNVREQYFSDGDTHLFGSFRFGVHSICGLLFQISLPQAHLRNRHFYDGRAPRRHVARLL